MRYRVIYIVAGGASYEGFPMDTVLESDFVVKKNELISDLHSPYPMLYVPSATGGSIMFKRDIRQVKIVKMEEETQ